MPPQAQTVELPRRLPLVTPMTNRDSTLTYDGRLVNAYAEKSPEGDYWIYKRPGMKLFQSFNATGRGVSYWKGDVYTVAGSTLYKNGVSIGTLEALSTGLFNFIGGTNQLLIKATDNAWVWDGSTLTQLFNTASIGPFTVTGASWVGGVATLTVTPATTGLAIGAKILVTNVTPVGYITAAPVAVTALAANTISYALTANPGAWVSGGNIAVFAFPTATISGGAYLDGTFYVMDSSSNIWGSAINDPTSWDPLNKIVAQIESDGGVALAKQLSYIIALKDFSTEVFYDAANAAGSPLASIPGSKVSYGCKNSQTVQKLGDTLLWITQQLDGIVQVGKLEQLNFSIISTPEIDRLIGDWNYTSVYSWTGGTKGHRFYGVTSSTSSMTLVYDVDQNLWYTWAGPGSSYLSIVASSVTVSNTSTIVLWQDVAGSLYSIDINNTNDYSNLIPVDIYTPNFDGGTRRRKTVTMLEVVADQVPGSILSIRSSDDDFTTWTNFRNLNLGMKRPILTNCGTFSRRGYHFRHSQDSRFRLQAVELQMDLGTL